VADVVNGSHGMTFAKETLNRVAEAKNGDPVMVPLALIAGI